MKRLILLLNIILFSVLLFSCDNTKKKVYNHNFGYILIDENSHFNDNYYSKVVNKTQDDYVYSIYIKDTNELIDQIELSTYKSCLCIYDDVIYVLYEKNDNLYYYYKKLGVTLDINDNIKCINDSNYMGIININNCTFFIKSYYHMMMIDYNNNQSLAFSGKPNYFCTLNGDKFVYSLNLLNDKKKIEIKKIDSEESYYYDFPKEIVDAKYNYKTNYAFWNWPKWNERDSFYFKNEYISYQNDNYVYFSYSKYLGEFDDAKHYCEAPGLCLFSNCKTEVLRFNCIENKIESVAILPDGYRVLKIYENGALIIKNNIISEFDFLTQELKNVQEVDWTAYYELNNDLFYELKIYLYNNRIEKLGSYYYRNSICYNFEVFEEN